MVRLAIESLVPIDCPIFVDTTEVDGGRYYPTVELMRIYRSKYPNLNFKVLIGTDLLASLHLWDEFSSLISENTFVVYTRISSKLSLLDENESIFEIELDDIDKTRLPVERIRNTHLFNPAVSNISSTEVRNRLRIGGFRCIIGLVPLSVLEYMRVNNMYSS